MVEVKELERALIARMFRSRIIDAGTFMSRVIALGYDSNDTFLMLQLEQADAAKTRLRSSGWFNTSSSVEFPSSQEFWSEKIDVVNVTYIMTTSSASFVWGGGVLFEMVFYRADNAEISRVNFTPTYVTGPDGRFTSGFRSFATSLPVGTSYFKCRVLHTTGRMGIGSSSSVGDIEAVVV